MVNANFAVSHPLLYAPYATAPRSKCGNRIPDARVYDTSLKGLGGDAIIGPQRWTDLPRANI